jgi:hypothetical protein
VGCCGPSDDRDREYDRISLHGVRKQLLAAQADAVGVPLIVASGIGPGLRPGCMLRGHAQFDGLRDCI